MTSQATLSYFDVPGRAFAIRACLRAANYPFVDERLKFPDLVAQRGPAGYNAKVPLGQLPTLTLPNGMVLVQSASIARWAAKKAHLYGSTDEDQLIIDSVVETNAELLAKAPQHADKEEKKKLRQAFAKEGLPKYLSYLSGVVEHSGGPYVLGRTFSLADIVMFNLAEGFANNDFDYISYAESIGLWPRLVTHHQAAKNHPVIKNEQAHDAEQKKKKTA